MDQLLHIIFVLFGLWTAYRCAAEDLYMQIIAPERGSITKSLENELRGAVRKANERRARGRNNRIVINPMTRAGIRLGGDIQFVDSSNPTPQELLDIFCDKIFANNASVISVISYDELTSQFNDYVINIAEHLGYPVISWDPLYPGALEVCMSTFFVLTSTYMCTFCAFTFFSAFASGLAYGDDCDL